VREREIETEAGEQVRADARHTYTLFDVGRDVRARIGEPLSGGKVHP